MKNDKFQYFSDAELYVLKRHAIESSYEIVMTDKYSKDVKKIHGVLMNEIIEEIKRRDKNKVYNE